MREKVLAVFGTRPEAIKMAPLVKELLGRDTLQTKVCVTAQHREMLDQVLQIFQIVPDYDLNIMRKGQSLSEITTRVLLDLDSILTQEQPALVLVHGDTTTSFAAALSAFYNRIPIGHVEAGLRTYKKDSPYPEEANRQFVDAISDVFFAPTEQCRQNLIREGKKAEQIFVTGNTAIDALQTTVGLDYHSEITDWVGKSRLLLLTAHRRENLGSTMEEIFRAVRRVVQENEDVKVVYPVHPNPAVVSTAEKVFHGCDRVLLTKPLDVVHFHNLMSRAYLILTDSGGIQEEAPHLGRPVLVLRNTTERPEGVAAGTLKLAGTAEESVYESVSQLLTDSTVYGQMSRAVNPYGDGHASRRIADEIVRQLLQSDGSR